MTKCSRSTCFRNLLWMHCNKLNRDAYIETLILSGVSLMMWPRLGKFVKLSWYTVVEQMNFKLESDECELCTESSLVWNQLIITSSCFQLCDVQIFHCQKVCAIEGLPLYPYNNKEICMALFHNRFLCRICITLHYFKHVAALSTWIICMSQWYLDCSVGQVGQQVWPTFNSGSWSDTYFGMRIYEVIKIISYIKIACCYSKDSHNLEVFWIIVVHYRLYTLY